MTEQSILDVRGVRFTYPSRGDAFSLAVRELVISRGEHTACIGPSGCGKTTLLRLVSGVMLPDAGSITLGGAELTALTEAARRDLRVRRIGMVFQHFALLDYLDAFENIILPYRIGRTLRLDAAAKDRARSLARSTGIDHALRRRPARLSHGERQRVAICRALVTRPDLLVCDEPTGNLDPDRSRSTLDLLLAEADAAGATVLMVTHDHELLGRFRRVVDVRRLEDPGDGA